MSTNPRLTRARRDFLMAPPKMVRLRGMSECPRRAASVILSRELTRSARAADLLACPPHLLDKDCLSCSFQPGLDRIPLGTDARHYVLCRKGLRLHGAVSDKVRDELCFILERCGIRTIAERPQSHRQMTSFRQREGAFLLKTPDLVLPCFDAPRSFTIVDIKIVDPAAASYVNMTSKSPLHRHRALEVAGPRDYFGPSRRPPLVLA